MRRRKVLAGLAVVGWLGVARGQQATKLPKIGFLGANAAGTQVDWTAAFVQRLRELGWTEGRTVAIEYRWADGRLELYDEIAREFVRQNVDVIVSQGAGALAARQATSTIPIVFPAAVNPLGSGLVESLSRPGANATGLSIQSTDLVGKRVGLLREVLVDLRRLGIMANTGYTASRLELREVETAARSLGLEVTAAPIERPDEIAGGFDALRGRAQALYVCPSPLVTSNRGTISALALAAGLPTMLPLREYVEIGGLMSLRSQLSRPL